MCYEIPHNLPKISTSTHNISPPTFRTETAYLVINFILKPLSGQTIQIGYTQTLFRMNVIIEQLGITLMRTTIFPGGVYHNGPEPHRIYLCSKLCGIIIICSNSGSPQLFFTTLLVYMYFSGIILAPRRM